MDDLDLDPDAGWGEMGGFDGTTARIDAFYSHIAGPYRGTTWARVALVGGRLDGQARQVPLMPAICLMAAEMPA